MKRNLALVLALFYLHGFRAQTWVEKMQKPNGNFYEVKAEFEAYWQDKDVTEKGKGYKVFKRWENFVERRVYPSGDLAQLSLTARNYQAFLSTYTLQNQGSGKGMGAANQIASATFTALGPFGPISGNAGGQLLKAGRINFITIDPNNSNLWVGAPAGGLWKSTNGGSSWTTNTDNLGVIGCSDLAIDPTNSSIMYLATGDGDAGDTRSIGVLKSSDGGLTWNITGFSYAVTSGMLIRRIIIHPTNTQILYIATNNGIYRTTNAGGTWTQVSAGSTYDLEFKPGNPNTVYAAGTTFKLSTNNGLTFNTISAGTPTTGVNRMAIAVTTADTNYVYVLASNSTGSGFQGFYRSINAGVTFSLMSSTPNLLGWASNGSDAGGQGWYDLCTAASPLNKDEVVVGGVNVWRSTNGGSTWGIYGHWTGSGAPFTHADHHDLEFDAGGTLYNTNDGTVYKRVGATWVEISGTMNISQIYKMGTSSQTANKWISGHQDNGTSIWTGSSYNAALGGDGMDCFIDRNSDLNVFGEYQNGAIQRSTNGGTSWTNATTGLSGTAPWVTIWKQDPQSASTIYVGYTDLFRSNNLAVTWSTLTPIPGAGTIREFAIAPSNNQIIYVLKSSGIFKTLDGGVSWSNATGIVPVASAAPEFICIDPGDPNNAWVVLSGYSAGNKVFVTTNGGASWTNFSANLPNIPGNCLIYQPGTNDRIYVGMDVGIYYRDNVQANWTLYSLGLPNVPVSDFEISPMNPSILYAATYGRGVWAASLYNANPTPNSSFTVTSAVKCEDNSIQFTDQSNYNPTAWSWSVTPSAGVIITSPNSQNPLITFPNGGNYTVGVQASNTVGAGSTYTQVVNITALPAIVINNANQSVCMGNTVSFSASGAATFTWSHGGGNGSNVTYTPTANTQYTLSGTAGGCSSSTVCSVLLNPLPTISINAPNAICVGASAVLMANGAATYSWNSGASGQIITVNPNLTTVYTVTGTTSGGCKSATSTTLTVNNLPQVSIGGATAVCQGSTAILTANGAFSYTWNTGNISGSIAVNPMVSTLYTLTGMDANGCVNSASLILQANPLPIIQLNLAQLTICSGEMAVLSASGAQTYTWMPGSVTGSQLSFTAGTSGVYTVTGTDANACSNSSMVNVLVAECLSLGDVKSGPANTFLVYPNPNHGFITVEHKESGAITVFVQVNDAMGRQLIEKQIQFGNNDNKTNLDLLNLAPGVYFMTLKVGEQQEVIRVVRSE
ncbi:MAG TPA: T9SS type A sorting domain-containing protein [Bacteroidia bacterium]|nr:T9SS type A sorting domain-containing protein [Bacteroidia bacterium]